MKIYSAICAVILSALSVQAMAGGFSSDTVTVRGLSAEVEVADFPVCFNGAGKLMPCPSGVEPPPVDDPYSGFWSGRMIYDRYYVGSNTCYDADVTIRIDPDGDYGEISSITIRRDVGGVDIYVSSYMHLAYDGYVADDFIAFGVYTDFSLLFNNHGYAEGVWSDTIYSDCNGTWSFTKD